MQCLRHMAKGSSSGTMHYKKKKKKSSYCAGFIRCRTVEHLPPILFLPSHTMFADPPFCGLGQLASYHCVDGE